MDTTIEIKNLSTGYKVKSGKHLVSEGLTASLERGEMVCMLGPNGAGKSTLLRTLSGFQPQMGGEIIMAGRNIGNYGSKELARVVSVVLTDNSSIRNMKAWDVVAMGRSPHTGFLGRLTQKDRQMVDKCLGWVGMESLAKRQMQTLSDGERQKIMIAKAIAQDTPIIFLDEPTAYLDYPSKIQMMMLLHRLSKAMKKTVFMSTHDLEHALQVADRVWLLDKEHGLTCGLPEDLSLDGSLERYFVRDGLSFDRETCAFAINHETARTLPVRGNIDTLEMHLCCKALVRNGIQPLHSPDAARLADVAIDVPGDGTFRLLEKSVETLKVTKIEHLLKTIVPAITRHQISAIRQAADMNPFE